MIHLFKHTIILWSKNNEYQIDKGYFLDDVQKGNLYQVAGTTQSTTKQGKNGTAFFESIFRLGSESKIYKARTYKFLDALGTIGGVYELTFCVLSLIFSCISRKLYFYHMVNNLKIDESHHKIKLDKVVENLDNQNSQSANRVSQNSNHFHKSDRYNIVMKALNDAKRSFELKNRSKMQKINSLK